MHLVVSFWDIYEAWAYTDMVMHTLGGMAIAFCFHRGIPVFREWFPLIDFSEFVHYVLSFALTGCAAVDWEFCEFICDHIFHTRLQRGLNDTLSDMALGIAGGLAMLALFCWLDLRKKQKESFSRKNTL